jgi:hypothetical protein
MKFSEIQENPENCSGFGFYIHNTHVHFPKQMSLLYTGGTEHIIPTKKNLKMVELQFLRTDRADIDAYRTQPFPKQALTYPRKPSIVNVAGHVFDELILCMKYD